jgi:transposase
VLAKTKTKVGRIWVYVRDDRPFGGKDPPAAFFEYSPSRHGEYPRQHLAGWSGVMQADAFAGFNELYDGARKPGPICEAACWAHGRRKFFELAKLAKAPIAHEAVRRIDQLFAIERLVNGKPPDERRAMRQERSKPLVIALEAFLREKRALVSAKSETAKAINYTLNRWAEFTRFLDDGRVCLSNNAAERGLRCVATLRSLCTSYSSIWKHWNLIFRFRATLAIPSGDRRDDVFSLQVACVDLVWCFRYNLDARQNSRFNRPTNRMMGYA